MGNDDPAWWCLSCSQEAQDGCFYDHDLVCRPKHGWYTCPCNDCNRAEVQMIGPR